MVKRMLIDATHPEETRVVVVNGTRLEELDVETSTKRQIKGNIYLAKIVRVEPSLQAAFVDYGGNRHGFLAFSEIHPDYFQIPVADRQALLAAQKAEVLKDNNSDHDHAPEAQAEGGEDGQGQGEDGAQGDDNAKPTPVEVVGGDDAAEQELERRRARLLRNYKIQEVIKRRQIMLVQVVKEERGNKGAALTTYLSLAGRYCVLMPNTARGGGVSRKIINANDRRRLKAIASELDCPEGMAVIVRTAGSERSKAEIKRDYEYLLRAWDQVRELTLKSSAPASVYEEASLIKRSIRDLYARDIDEVLVEGDEGYRLAKDYMRMLTPSHAKKVQPYKDPTMPLFHRYQVDSQLDAMHSPVVQLKSGGYIVISQTEALVAIDVNSGRATRERHIEETAVKTNLEAADEISRQLRLRDLAGLIVIDFIDMEENRNNHSVERRLKEALKNDRARIQVGKISAFGLLELSRQRLRPSLQETAFTPCPHCAGTGLIRSVESAAVHVLRAIEEEGIRRRSSEVTVYVPSQIALYILNQKRDALAAIEERYLLRVYLLGDDELIAPNLRMERVKAEGRPEELLRPAAAVTMESASEAEIADEQAEDEDDESEESPETEAETEAETENETEARGAEDGEAGADGNRKRRRRRRRKRRPGGPDQNGDQQAQADGDEGESEGDEEESEGEESAEGANAEAGDVEGESESERRKRRRGRRGGRRRRRGRDEAGNEEAPRSTAEGEGDSDGEGDGEAAANDQAPARAPAPARQSAPPRAPAPIKAPGVPGMALMSNPDAVADVFERAEAMALAEVEARTARAAEPQPEAEAIAASEPVAEAAAEAQAKAKRVRAPAKAKGGDESEPTVEKPKRSRAKAEAKPEKAAKPSRAKKAADDGAEPAAAPKRARKPKASEAEPVTAEPEPAPTPEVVAEPVVEQAAPAVVQPEPVAEPEPAPAAPAAAEEVAPAPAMPARRGWWNKLLS
ncbi:ribonuclease E/G [Magnetospirillum moscoviense]|uniref:Ribonuclease E n=1 Tax=Magnetospirillum moscoviense TaxID=1437059 RepID=A0A178MIW3_9PROT|nr:ribonuclease E/G [Magnetospirillum moscoviense]OAN47944.1 ribonuclease E [Magnetospirillum moscoviense]